MERYAACKLSEYIACFMILKRGKNNHELKKSLCIIVLMKMFIFEQINKALSVEGVFCHTAKRID